jgi:hypothetical protein
MTLSHLISGVHTHVSVTGWGHGWEIIGKDPKKPNKFLKGGKQTPQLIMMEFLGGQRQLFLL